MSRDNQTAAESIAIKADAYGLDGGQVDGNDPLAVQEFVGSALETARAGDPILVESLTYRHGAHTTSDDPERYRDDDTIDLPEWRTADPIERFEGYLREQDVIEDGFVSSTEDDAREDLSAAVEAIEETETKTTAPADMFESVYDDLTPRLRNQRAFIRSR